MSEFKGKLHETVVKFPCTDIWNDSCAQDDLEYAIERGAVGATTNPVIVKDVLKKEMPIWAPRIRELNEQMPEATEDDIAWALIEEIAAQLAVPVGTVKSRLFNARRMLCELLEKGVET